MRRRTSLLLAALALAGCGGSNHGGSSSASASESYASGVKSLGSALASTGDRTSSLKAAQTAFDRAYAKNPNDPRNAMGYALSTAGLDATALGTAIQGKAVASRLTVLGGLGTRLGSKKAGLAALLPILAARPAKRDDGTLASLQSDLHKIVDRLTDARIEALEANPVVLTTDDTDGVAIKVGTVEGYALRSAAEAALGFIDGALAYHTDYGAYDPDALFLEVFPTQVAAGTTITPAQYLPTGSYGTPNANAGTLLADLKVEWTGTAADGASALARLGTRAGTGWLTDLDPLSDDDKAMLSSSLALLKATLAGPTSVPITLPDGTATTITVNVAAVVAKPPADVRAFYPTIRPVPTPPSPDDTTTLLNLVPGSVADPTLGGLVPGGLPTPLLYGRTLNVDEDTTQGEVATWAFPLSSLSG